MLEETRRVGDGEIATTTVVLSMSLFLLTKPFPPGQRPDLSGLRTFRADMAYDLQASSQTQTGHSHSCF